MYSSPERRPRVRTTPAASVTALTKGILGVCSNGAMVGAELLLFFLRLFLRLAAREPTMDRFEQPLHGEGLANVIDDAQVLGVRLVPAAFVSGDHDDRRRVG